MMISSVAKFQPSFAIYQPVVLEGFRLHDKCALILSYLLKLVYFLAFYRRCKVVFIILQRRCGACTYKLLWNESH